jgi:protein-tyrosine-phosphatase
MSEHELSNTPHRILFVCVENSCRSQMAQGFARAIGGANVIAASAGSRPSGRVDERAIRFMAEKGVDLRSHISKGLDDLPSDIEWDTIVTMGCGDACPAVAAHRRIDWDLPDPKALDDAGFRAVRDRIGQLVREVLA